MKVVTVHSHKGGSGKTTLGVSLAQQLASSGKKVCLIDLDLVGPGVEYLVPCDVPCKYVNDFISTKEMELGEITAKGCVCRGEKGAAQFDVVLASSRFEDFDRVYGELLYEHTDDSITGVPLQRLLEGLQDRVEVVIVDNSPGLAYVSAKTLVLSRRSSAHSGTAIFVTSLERADFVGFSTRMAGLSQYLSGYPSLIVINKVRESDKERVQSILGGNLGDLIDQDGQLKDRRQTASIEAALRWSKFIGGQHEQGVPVVVLPFDVSVWRMSRLANPYGLNVLRLSEDNAFRRGVQELAARIMGEPQGALREST